MFKEETIQRVKDASIHDVVASILTLKKSGPNYLAHCPFHKEHSPSFTVSPAKGIFKCFGCGKSGDGIAFVMEHEKLAYIEAIRFIASKLNIEIEEEDSKKAPVEKPVPRLEKLGPKSLAFLEGERKISNNTLLRFGITETVQWMPKAKTEVLCICFNYFRNEELINIKFRGPGKDFMLNKNSQLIFYNLDAIKGEKECVIVEGEIDALSMHESGIFNVVSVPNGASAKGEMRLEYLDNCYDAFIGIEKIILATDNDEAGKRLRAELARRLGKDRCYQVEYPAGCKDSNDVLKTLGPAAVKEMVAKAKEWPLEGIITFNDIEAEFDDFYENGYPPGLRTHIPGFDQLLTFFPGQLTTVTGAPGSGKSEFVDLIMTSLSNMHNVRWCVFSFETTPTKHATKLAEKIIGRAFDFRKNPEHRINRKQLEYAKSEIRKNFYFMSKTLQDVTMDGLLQKAEEMVQRKGIDGFLFDPWNCIEAKYGSESETKYVLTCLNKLIAFLERYNVHGILVAHPTKLQKDKKTGQTAVPTLYDISGSAHFFNRTHSGMAVDRNKQTGQVDIYIQKVKDSWLGNLGVVSYYYDTMTREYKYITDTPQQNGKPASSESGTGWVPLDIPGF
jgi:twinkle protein